MLNILTQYPWAITETELQSIIKLVDKFDITAARQTGFETSASERVQVFGNIAVINIKGSIFRYSNIFTDYYNLTTIDNLLQDVEYIKNLKDIEGVLINADSGGGQANGISEAAGIFRTINKPTKTYIAGSCASACYWLGSTSDEIIINKTGITGSIGAMLEVIDDTELLEKWGIKKTVYKSEVSPNKNSDTGLQTLVNRLGEEFVIDVAKNQNVTFEYVLENYGKGGLFVGQDAVNAGLADKVGTFEEVLASFGTSNQSSFNSAKFNAQQRQINLLKEI